jgi:hypothetical protein
VANLEIGGYFTPDGILSAAERVAAAVRQISHEINAILDDSTVPSLPGDFLSVENDWDTFSQEFLAWKGEHTSWVSRAWDTTRDELSGFVERYQALRPRWAKVYPATAAPDLNVTSDTIGGALKDAGKAAGAALQSIGIGLAVVLGVGIAAYVVWKASA